MIVYMAFHYAMSWQGVESIGLAWMKCSGRDGVRCNGPSHMSALQLLHLHDHYKAVQTNTIHHNPLQYITLHAMA